MKYLITGLGNIGPEYVNTRHNIGFEILDALAKASNISFSDRRYGFVTELKYKSRILVLLKPGTYVNRSGLAVNFWLKKEKVPVENLLVVADDLALPFGTLRLKPSGGDGGHNGLSNIIQVLGTQNFARIRFGIGNDFSRGRQVDYVLGKWEEDEMKDIPSLLEKSGEIIKSFATIGIELAMNQFNNK
ncbi:MAG: aminoacyl-tRNA hydrolase [Bacteroidales bacterium]|nr:aminoacyl-tRNA hydrolase [Bacteroidales bacterium]